MIRRNEIRRRDPLPHPREAGRHRERPRLNVYRSLNHIYAQVIDDSKGVTVVSASTLARPRRQKDRRQRRGSQGSRQADRREGPGKGHQESGLRSRRLPVSRPHQGAGRCGSRSRTGVLDVMRSTWFDEAASPKRAAPESLEKTMAIDEKKLDADQYNLKDQVVASTASPRS